MIRPHRLRHDGADDVEWAGLQLDSRPARQPNDNTARGRYYSHRPEQASIPRYGAPSSATGCVIFRTHAPASPQRPELLLPIVERGLGHLLSSTEPPHRQAGIEKTPESPLPQRGLLRIGRTCHVEPPGHQRRPPTDAGQNSRPVNNGSDGRLQAGYERAADCLADDLNRCLAFYQFPEAHWPHLRTTNVIESPFAGVRLRTNAAKRFKKTKSGVCLVHQVLLRLSQTWRHLTAAHLCGQVPLPASKTKLGKKINAA